MNFIKLNIQKWLYKKGFILTREVVNLGRKRNISMFVNGSADFCRVATLELCAYEIHNRKIIGEIAEVGVYKGDFALKLSQLFPKRKLYLFDTFEGFDERDISLDKKFSNANRKTFADTSIELIREKISHNKLIIRKGYFPDTLKDDDYKQQFAFVSLDTDLFKPIYDGLSFFYPRLAKGGYIFIHDYNNTEYAGCKEAVNQYIQENNITTILPISDGWGTLIITK